MRVAVALSLLTLALAGCGTESSAQQVARSVLEVHLAGNDRYEGRVHCTDHPRPWLITFRTDVFLCAARRADGDCDWFRLTIGDGEPDVKLERDRAGCTLPP